jgi:acyl carrier protein
MNLQDIEKKVIRIVADKLGFEEGEVSLTSKIFDDLGADSLDTVELIMEMEKEFDISIPDEVAERMEPTIGDAFEQFFKFAPREFLKNITTRALCFKFNPDGRIAVMLKLEDGSWTYADGVKKLPSSICVLSFSKWSNILKELEDIINDPNSKEQDVQKYFETYPELIAGNDYDVVLPQAVIVRDDDSNWKPDFVLTPKNQSEFAKILDLKIPSMETTKRPNSGHYNFSAKLWNGIMQVRDYSREFDKSSVREKFKNTYEVDIYKPDLHLIAGRKWDIQVMDKMRELQRETQVKVEDWDSLLDRLKRNF